MRCAGFVRSICVINASINADANCQHGLNMQDEYYSIPISVVNGGSRFVSSLNVLRIKCLLVFRYSLQCIRYFLLVTHAHELTI